MRFLTLSFFFLLSNLKAEETKVCKTPLYLFFVNGMQNSPYEAEEELDQLIIHLEGHIDSQIPWASEDSSVAYVSDNGFFDNLIEVVEEKRLENLDTVWDAYFNSPKASEKTMTEFSDYLAKERLTTHDAEDYGDQISEYSHILGQGYQLMVVAHSQGNLIVNAVWQTLKHDQMFSDMNIIETHKEIPFYQRMRLHSTGTPSSYVANDGSYTTLTTDEVIKHLDYLINEDIHKGKAKSPLPPNVTNTNIRHTFLSHEFISDYLGGDPSESHIVQGIESEMKKLADLDKQQPKTASKECLSWFRNLKIDNSQTCMAQCSTGRVNMDSFVCPKECPILCRCYY